MFLRPEPAQEHLKKDDQQRGAQDNREKEPKYRTEKMGIMTDIVHLFMAHVIRIIKVQSAKNNTRERKYGK
jgi:uncharacterized DUF497 family protein